MIQKIYRKIIMIVFTVMCICLLYPGQQVQAAGMVTPDDFKSLSGEEGYINEEFTYRLDMVKPGLLEFFDKSMNSVNNVLFSMETGIARLAIFIFYHCMNFDVAQDFAEQLKVIQTKLHTSVFEPFLWVAFMGVGIKLLGRLFRRNFVGAMTDVFGVFAIMAFSLLVVFQSDKMLSMATSASKEIAGKAMISLNSSMGQTPDGEFDENYITSYAVQASGVLWVNMIHNPWLELELEFGKMQPDSSQIDQLMRTSSKKEREKIVEEMIEKDSGYEECFGEENSNERMGALIVYFIPLAIKAVIYIGIAGIQFFFQLMAVFFLLLSPIILVLSLFPGYGFGIIETWLRKMLEYQIGIVIVTMLLSFLIYLDNSIFQSTGDLGWLITSMFQVIVAASLILGRSAIFKTIQKVQQSIQTPVYAKTMLRRAGEVKPGRRIGGTIGARRGQGNGVNRQSGTNSLRASVNNARETISNVSDNLVDGGVKVGLRVLDFKEKAENIHSREDVAGAVRGAVDRKTQIRREKKEERRTEKSLHHPNLSQMVKNRAYEMEQDKIKNQAVEEVTQKAQKSNLRRRKHQQEHYHKEVNTYWANRTARKMDNTESEVWEGEVVGAPTYEMVRQEQNSMSEDDKNEKVMHDHVWTTTSEPALPTQNNSELVGEKRKIRQRVRPSSKVMKSNKSRGKALAAAPIFKVENKERKSVARPKMKIHNNINSAAAQPKISKKKLTSSKNRGINRKERDE